MFIFVCSGHTTLNDAIEASIKNPEVRVEIFCKKGSKFLPSYNYYKNGELIVNNI